MGSISTTTSTGQYLTSPKNLETKSLGLPPLGDDEVQIAPRAVTLCGSDLHYYNHGRNGSILVREPLCLGHECAGDVEKVGASVKGLKPGDRVAIECGVSCQQCEFCEAGRYNLCPKMRFRSSGSAFPHFQGTLQERVNHPASWTHKLPDGLTHDDGALLEPLAVACHAVRRAGVTSSSSCLIMGAGAVGLLCAAVARFHGCSRIIICDIDERRVDFAIKQGFAECGWYYSPKRGADIDEELGNARTLAEQIASQLWPDGGKVGKPQMSFECTGVPSCAQTSIYATKSGGRVMLVGMGTPHYMLPISEASAREIDLMPTWRYDRSYEEAIELMSDAVDGKAQPDMRKLITHRIKGLDKVDKAFSLAGRPQDGEGNMVIKVLVNV